MGIATLHVKVTPNAKKFQAAYDKREKTLKARLESAPQDGKANEELLKKLRKMLKAKVSMLRGHASREKLLEIELSEEKLLEELERLAPVSD